MGIKKRYLGPVLLAVLALGLSACGGGGGSGDSSSKAEKTVSPADLPPATITVWSWEPNIKQQAEGFTKEYPNIKVNAINGGVYLEEYSKFRSALKAGSGGPDALLLTNDVVASFAQTGDLVSLTEAGISEADIRKEFPDWAVNLASYGDGIYDLPGDAGLMSFLYQPALLQKNGIAVPKTWDEFEAAAIALHKKDPGTYLTSVPTNAADWLFSLMAQNGWKPFDVNGTDVKIDIDSPEGAKVAEYWANLVKQGAAKAESWYTNEWISEMSGTTYSGWVSADWGPAVLAPSQVEAGTWRAGLLPKWSSDNGYPTWGPGGYGVSSQSKYPEQAAAFANWVVSDKNALQYASPYGYPPAKVLTTDPEFINKSLPFYGPQKANRLYIEEAEDPGNASASWDYSPLYAYTLGQANELFSGVFENGDSMSAALETLQQRVADYAKQQGYTVSE